MLFSYHMRADFLTKEGENTVYLVLYRTENSGGDITYNVVIVVNNTVSYI